MLCSESRFRALPQVLLLVGLLTAATACAPRVVRGGAGTENPGLDDPALSTSLDKRDIDYLVSENLGPLMDSRYWRQDVVGARKQPLVAIWPIRNATTHHLDDQMLQLLSSVETTLVNSGDVRVIDKARQAEWVREIGVQQGEYYDPATAQRFGRQMGAQYLVTGKLTSVDERLQKNRRVQYTLFLQVVELETGLIKFQFESARSKALKG